MGLIIGVLAAIGLVASITVHVSTFFPEQTVVTTGDPLFAVLHVGIFGVFVPYILSVRQRFGAMPRGWRGYLSVFPAWARTLIMLAAAYAAVSFFHVLSGQHGLPGIRDGQFVLIDHGKFIRTLTQTEYDVARSQQTRLFSGHWIMFYLIPTLYFLFAPQSGAPSQTEREHPGC